MNVPKILVTGASGFIGFHLSRKLAQTGNSVFGIDSLNDYYDVNLKTSRLSILKSFSNFTFLQTDIARQAALDKLFLAEKFDYVVNLAAQAGVRYSLVNPHAYPRKQSARVSEYT